MPPSTASQLITKAMDLAANPDVAGPALTWLNWSIDEIWNDRLWDFRRREATPLSIAVDAVDAILDSTFDKPGEFRIVTSGKQGKLYRIDENFLKLYVSDITDLSKKGTPKFWIHPIIYDGTTEQHKVRFWPPSDSALSIAYSFFRTHPVLGSNDKHLLPERCEKVIVARTVIYIKESEDEVSLTGPERQYDRLLAFMRSHEARHPDSLPGWKHELQLRALSRVLLGGDPSLDLGR